ncbi:MAG: tRNA uridine-5-carboxymethylaminomethyl(34) synthesis GTPase MnmE [Rickettsiales bacterium]|jgi:tRNA modification GTPase|nr:tRNA uridine-5-carboxymethylaminomethyl(34) synthesis GTPase MnmE [Rickettsiales bacterium]
MSDTIFALSSGHGKAGIAVIRISGSEVSPFSGKPQPRRAYLTNLTDENGALIDQCIVIYFSAPNSFTGEDMIEIHCHGAPAVVRKIFEFLRGRGMRMAEPGEFSRRAFYNNKIDLAEVDGLAALLDARTDRQRAAALKSMTGGDSTAYESWRAQMVEIAAYSAAILDYPADELPKNIGAQLLAQTKKLYEEIIAALNGYAAARAIRSGFNIVLAGETNVGKSSLFNRLVGSARAIVSDIPGTTRDLVGAELDIDGYLVNLSDTAGLRDSDDSIEKIGIEKTYEAVREADLIIRVQSAECQTRPDTAQENEIIVINKSDLLDKDRALKSKHCVLVSAHTGAGIPELLDKIKKKIHDALDGAESDISVNERARGLLIMARDELKSALDARHLEINYDIFAEHVRAAADCIGRVLGVISASEVMDAAFGQLCLGK